MYPHITGPQSKFPMKLILIGKNIVGINMKKMNQQRAKNFPKIISFNFTGKVTNISYEPILNSSEKLLIVIAGTIKDNAKGRSSKKSLRDA
ncbi:hypothetical protein JCM12298_14490 [Desulfothermus naphthae]